MKVALKTEKRERRGKQNKSLLRSGIVPGAICRNKQDTLVVQANEHDLIDVVRANPSDIIEVEYDGNKYNTVKAEIVINPLTNKIEAFTLTELTPESHVNISVPVVLKGISPAVKNNLGVLIVNLPAIRMQANLTNLIPEIEVDISNLSEIGSRILVSDLPIIKTLKLASEKDRTLTVVTIRPLQKVETVVQAVTVEGTPVEGETPVEGATEEPKV